MTNTSECIGLQENVRKGSSGGETADFVAAVPEYLDFDIIIK